MTRIRYYKTVDPSILCTNVLFSGSNAYRAYLYYSELEIHSDIRNNKGEIVLAFGAYNFQSAKNQIRQALINLGVEFHKERRIRKVGTQ